VHPHELHTGQELEGGDRLRRSARGDGEAELGVLLPGAHELVGVCLDARRHPDEDPRPGRGRRGRLQQAAETGHLVEGVHDDAADAVLEGGGQLARRLVVAVQDEALRGHAGRERHMELATGRDVEVHALLVGQPGHGPAQEGLGGVSDAVPPGRHSVPAGTAQVVLVVDEQRGPELLGQFQEVDAADVEVALLVDGGGAREEVALQGCGGDVVIRRHGDAGYGSLRASRRRRDRCG